VLLLLLLQNLNRQQEEGFACISVTYRCCCRLWATEQAASPQTLPSANL